MAQLPQDAQSPRRWLWPLVLLAAAFGLYATALANPFISDDKAMLGDNATITQPSLASLRKLWYTHYWARINPSGTVNDTFGDKNIHRPVVVLSYWLNSSLSAWTRSRLGVAPAPAAPWEYRWANVVLHALAAYLVGQWVRRWTSAAGGVVAAGLVLLHPVATDPINRIVGRADILVLVGVAGFLLMQRRSQEQGWNWPRTLAAFLAAAVALGSKESGAILLPLALGQEYLGLGHPRDLGARRAWRGGLALAVALGGYLVLRWLAVRPMPAYRIEPNSDILENPLLAVGWAERIAPAFYLAWQYLGTVLTPWPLLVFYNPVALPGWSDPRTWLGAAAVAALAAALVILIRRRHVLALGALWFFAALAIVGQLLVPIGTFFDVRLVYPLLGALGLTAGWLTHRFRAAAPRLRERAVWGACIVAVLAVWAVQQRNHDFRDEAAMLEADLTVIPDNPASCLRLASVYFSQKDPTACERLLLRAARGAPHSSAVWYDLGNFEMRYGTPARAKSMYERALEANAANGAAMSNLGVLYLNEGDLVRAEPLLRRGVELTPSDDMALVNLAIVDFRLGRLEQAVARLEYVIARSPGFRPARDRLAELQASIAASRPAPPPAGP